MLLDTHRKNQLPVGIFIAITRIIHNDVVKFSSYGFTRGFKTGMLVLVMSGLGKTIMVPHKIHDLRFLHFEGIVQLTDQYVPYDEVITDTTGHQYSDGGKHTDTIVFADQLHPVVNLYPIPYTDWI